MILLAVKLTMRTILNSSSHGVLFSLMLACKTCGFVEVPQTAARRCYDLCQPTSCDAPERVLPTVFYSGRPDGMQFMVPEVANMLPSDHGSCFCLRRMLLALAGSAWIARVLEFFVVKRQNCLL